MLLAGLSRRHCQNYLVRPGLSSQIPNYPSLNGVQVEEVAEMHACL